jgi:hypothetical protein
VTDHFGSAPAFATLAAIGAVGLTLVALTMPETRPPEKEVES